jgi:hypothetical protein
MSENITEIEMETDMAIMMGFEETEIPDSGYGSLAISAFGSLWYLERLKLPQDADPAAIKDMLNRIKMMDERLGFKLRSHPTDDSS